MGAVGAQQGTLSMDNCHCLVGFPADRREAEEENEKKEEDKATAI